MPSEPIEAPTSQQQPLKHTATDSIFAKNSQQPTQKSKQAQLNHPTMRYKDLQVLYYKPLARQNPRQTLALLDSINMHLKLHAMSAAAQ